MDYVLLSPNDGELLKKAHQMLLEGGVNDNVKWNKVFNPDSFNERATIEHRSVYCYALYIDDGELCFFSHTVMGATPITLTPENLSESVATVLNAYKQAQS